MTVEFLGSGAETFISLLEKDLSSVSKYSQNKIGEIDKIHIVTVSASGADKANKIRMQMDNLNVKDPIRNSDRVIYIYTYKDELDNNENIINDMQIISTSLHMEIRKEPPMYKYMNASMNRDLNDPSQDHIVYKNPDGSERILRRSSEDEDERVLFRRTEKEIKSMSQDTTCEIYRRSDVNQSEDMTVTIYIIKSIL